MQITGSGGLALIAALGSEARAEGRLKVGDMVAVYSGTSDLLSPAAGRDPMFADFSIQGYETKTGSHAQFLTVQAPQLHGVPGDLTLEQAGSYILNLGTIVALPVHHARNRRRQDHLHRRLGDRHRSRCAEDRQGQRACR